LEFERLGLEEAEFWSAPLRLQAEWCGRMAEEEFQGLLLDTPSRVPPAARDTLPMVVGWGTSLQASAQAPFGAHALVTAVDLRRNRVRVAKAKDLERPAPQPRNPNARLPDGHMAGFQLVDARERLRLPWEPGDWLLRTILREHVSNARHTTILPPVGEGFTPSLTREDPPAIHPPVGDPLPSYRARRDSPALGAGAALALAVERVTPLRDDPQVVLRGAFRLPALPHERVDPAAWQGQGPAPRAVIAVSLLLPTSLAPRTSVYRLQVPCWGEPDAEGRHEGWFALDLLPWLARESHTVFVYAFSGEQLAGPVPAALVAAADLPEGS
jgi:hypothetical protein